MGLARIGPFAAPADETRVAASGGMPDRLNSWKEIACYLSTSVRTAQRWESAEGLPVRRHEHDGAASVYAIRSDVDEWLRSRTSGFERSGAHDAHFEDASTRPPTRVVVLPFRLLRPDSDIAFLSRGLADAITASLSAVESIIVRSPLTAARCSRSTDVRRIAADIGVDYVVVGTLLRQRDRIRVAAQVIEAATDRVVFSHGSEARQSDIFQLQDQIVRRVIESMAFPLSLREQKRLSHDIPASAVAYEYYLRANELSHNYHTIGEAHDLYLRAVNEDPVYAPAWAGLGRSYRVFAKFGCDQTPVDRAEHALYRALELNPELSVAHSQMASLEADCGRGEQAMTRLLQRIDVMRNDPELLSGLVHVCRFCGLLEASVAAHERACRLDPRVRTTVTHTHFMRGQYDLALDTSHDIRDFLGPLALAAMGRWAEARSLARQRRGVYPLPLVERMIASVDLLVTGAPGAREMCEGAISAITHGPEELYYQSRNLVYLGDIDRGAEILGRAVESGFFCYGALSRDPWLQPLRATRVFEQILGTAAERHASAVRAFVAAGGERLFPPLSPGAATLK